MSVRVGLCLLLLIGGFCVFYPSLKAPDSTTAKQNSRTNLLNYMYMPFDTFTIKKTTVLATDAFDSDSDCFSLRFFRLFFCCVRARLIRTIEMEMKDARDVKNSWAASPLLRFI